MGGAEKEVRGIWCDDDKAVVLRYGGSLCTISHCCFLLSTAALWTRYPVELQRSTFNSDRFDTPNEGAAWLSSFKSMNGDLIKSLEVSCFLLGSCNDIWDHRVGSLGTSDPEILCEQKQ